MSACGYWVPAFAGMTVLDRHSFAVLASVAAPSRCEFLSLGPLKVRGWRALALRRLGSLEKRTLGQSARRGDFAYPGRNFGRDNRLAPRQQAPLRGKGLGAGARGRPGISPGEGLTIIALAR